MRASVASQIKPHTANREQSFNDLPVAERSNAVDSTGEAQRTSFKDLIMQSNSEIKEERKAKKAKDYSNLSEEEFLKRLQEDSKPKVEAKNKLGKDDFLKLFVTQLQNQDPLSPDDGAEMASKLAQFNSLEQQVNTNKSLDKLIKAENTAQNRQLTNYIGKEIKLQGGHIRVAKGVPDHLSFKMPVNATKSTLVVRNHDGIKVAETELGNLKMGPHNIGWDGKGLNGKPVPNGMYSFDIKAKTIDGQDVDVPLTTPTKILGVDLKDQERSLYTTYGRVSMNDVSAVGYDGFAEPEESAAAQSQAKAPPTTGSKPSDKGLANQPQANNLRGAPPASEGQQSGPINPAQGKPINPNLAPASKQIPMQGAKGASPSEYLSNIPINRPQNNETIARGIQQRPSTPQKSSEARPKVKLQPLKPSPEQLQASQ